MNFSQLTLNEYLHQLSQREPVPGGGSAAALTAALGVGLISMVIRFSIGRKTNAKQLNARFEKMLVQSESIRTRLLELVTDDAKAYLAVSQARTANVKTKKKASKFAREVPEEVCRLCYKAVQLAPVLVDKGNPYLLSDIEVAVELLMAGFNSAKVMVRVNS